MGSEKEVGNTILSATIKQKGLGVTISTDTNVLKHCGVSAFEGTQIIGVIRRNETYTETIANFTFAYSNKTIKYAANKL